MRGGLYSSSYVLVTPVREDAAQLDDLVATVRAQELPPALWLIVDDGSGDDTEQRLQRVQSREPWIHTLMLPRATHGHPRVRADLLTQGFRRVAELAEAERIHHEYVVNLDPDLRCAPQLLVEMVERSDRDRTVGIVSCPVEEVGDDGRAVRRREGPAGIGRDDLRLWRRACLEEVGMQPAPRWAETTGLWARSRGWQTVVYEDLTVEAMRPGLLREGGWHEHRHQGAEGWAVGMHPLVLAGQAVEASMADRDLRGVAMVAGYVEAAISGQRQTRDPELRAYFGKDLLEQQARRLLSRVPMVGRRFRRRR